MQSESKSELGLVQIVIVGLGARGLSVLERIVAHYRTFRSLPHAQVHVIDPREHGTGTHVTRQPDHLLINTVASQVTMFADETVEMEGPIVPGPTLADWARSSGYRRIGGSFVLAPGQEGQEIEDNDYVPRRLLGDYLSCVSDGLVHTLPENLAVEFHRAEATDIENEPSGRHRVILQHGFSIPADYVYLCLGHGVNLPSERDHQIQSFVSNNRSRNADLGYYRSCYPLTQLEEIAPKATVAVQGVGLSAHDVIAELTVGRRGRFSTENARLRYIPSGREPNIVLFSRSGFPFEARGVNQKGRSGQYIPVFFTEKFVREQKRCLGRLDFFRDLLPCLVEEMKHASKISARTNGSGGRTVEEARLDCRINAIFERPERPLHQSLEEFRDVVRGFLEEDILAADEGNVEGPYKAATDVLRDVRDTIRFAVDWGGLEPASHREFLWRAVPIMNRVAVGPPKVRNEQLLALMKSGVVAMAAGPGATVHTNVETAKFEIKSTFTTGDRSVDADVLVVAMIDPFYPLRDSSDLVRNLLRRGSITPYFNGDFHPGGIAISGDFRPIKANQQVQQGIWALGSLVEGPNFYTFVLPRPGVNSRFIRDADQCVAAMISDVLDSRGRSEQQVCDEAV